MPDGIIAVFVWLLGLAVGSFLNVVVYRLPLGISINKPARSFCPNCKEAIAWHDNLPVVGWLLLRGRCRNCKLPISVQYPIVEAITGLVFLSIYFLLAIMHSREGVGGLRWPADAPLLLAWLVLAVATVACAAMDTLSYMVDTRITDYAMFAGLLLIAIWPDPAFAAGVANEASPLSAAVVCMFLASGVMLWLTVWRHDPEPATSDAPTSDARASAAPSASSAAGATVSGKSATAEKPTLYGASVASIAAYLVVSVWLLIASFGNEAGSPGVAAHPPIQHSEHSSVRHAIDSADPSVPIFADLEPFRASHLPFFAAGVLLFVSIVIAGGQQRAVDAELHDAIEAEQAGARRTAMSELAWLTPIMAAGAIGYFLVAAMPAAADIWRTAIAWSPVDGVFPVAGAVHAILGVIIAAGAGWALRLIFTLALGREAFGTGDIFILAAAGGCVGWDIALAGLALAVALALAGWLLSLLLKQSSIIPFGPWLAAGFIGALWLNRPINDIVRQHCENLVDVGREQPQMLWQGGAILLAGGVIAVVLARLLRRSLEGADDPPPTSRPN